MNMSRYPRWLRNAMETKEKTERFWTKEQCLRKDVMHHDERKPVKSHDAIQSELNTSRSRPAQNTVWDAIAANDGFHVREALEDNTRLVLIRREGTRQNHFGGGTTMLHEAAFHGALDVTKHILSVLESHFSEDIQRAMVNAIDTTYSRTTALIAACRCAKGMMTARLEIVRLLIEAGADIDLQDAHGDNALHWCARTSNIVLLHYLLKATDAGVNAVFAENYKREKPIDIAKRQLSRKCCFETTSVVQTLENVDSKCNLRLKMQVLKRHHTAQQHENQNHLQAQCAMALETADIVANTVERQWADAIATAEKLRLEAETKHIDTAVAVARSTAMVYLDSKEGKLYMKKAMTTVTEDIKADIQRNKITKPKDMKKAAFDRAQESFIQEKEQIAKQNAQQAFRIKNPVVPKDIVSLRALAEK